MDRKPDSGPTNWLRSQSGLALLGFLTVAAIFLWTEHRAHLLGILPYVLLLLCPLLHFLHGGHGGRGGHHERGNGDDPK